MVCRIKFVPVCIPLYPAAVHKRQPKFPHKKGSSGRQVARHGAIFSEGVSSG